MAWVIVSGCLGVAGCTCGPADPIMLVPDGSVALPVPTDDNVYTCRCVCEVPIEHTSSCPNIDLEGYRAFSTTGRVGGPNEGRDICQIGTSLPFCFPPDLNPAHADAIDGVAHTPTNAEIFADCRDRAGFMAEEVVRSVYRGCGMPEPDGTCATSACAVDCECGAILDGAGNVATTADAKCNETCPSVAYDRSAGPYGNRDDATFVTAPNELECPLTEDTPVACRPPQLDPPGIPPDGFMSGWFGPVPGRVTAGHGTIAINDEAAIPVAVVGAVSLGRAPCTGCVTPLALNVRIADFTLPGRADLSNISMVGAILPPGVPVDGLGHAVIPVDAFLGTVRATACRTELGITECAERAYFVPNPTPMYLDLDPIARAFTLTADFFARIDAGTTAQFELRLVGVFDALPPVAAAGPDRVLECTSAGGALVTLDGTGSTDPDGDIMAYEWIAIAPYENLGAVPILEQAQPLGTRIYELGVSDALFAITTDQLIVDVVDTAGPELTVVATPDCLWPPNHRLVRLALGESLEVSTEDACGTVGDVRVVGVHSDQPDEGIGDGRSEPDVYFGPGGVCLRAERDARGGAGRTYTITVETSDANGTVTSVEVPIVVPHSRACANVDGGLLVEDSDAPSACAFLDPFVPPAPVSPTASGEPPVATMGDSPATARDGSPTPSCSAGMRARGISLVWALALLAGAVLRRRSKVGLALLLVLSGCSEEPAYVVSTIAGGTASRYADGMGTDASFRDPTSLVMGDDGNLYVGEHLRVRRVTPSGVVTTLAGGGTGETGFDDGVGIAASFFGPVSVAYGGPDRLFVADGGNHCIRVITISTAEVTTLVGGTEGYVDGAFAEARLDHPRAMILDEARGLLFVYDTGDHRIRVVDLAREEVRTLAGSGLRGYADGTGMDASFAGSGVALDGTGGLFVEDSFNHVIRHVTAGGVVTTLVGDSTEDAYREGQGAVVRLRAPAALLPMGPGHFWLADAGALVIRDLDVDSSTTRWIAGRPRASGYEVPDPVDGPALEAVFQGPRDMAMGEGGRIYVLDGNAVRVIAPAP